MSTIARQSILAVALLAGACAERDPEATETSDSGSETGSDDESSSETGSGESDGESSTETGGPTPDLPDPITLPDPLVVMTFNILCSFCDDSYDPWDDRVVYISDTIARHAPDVAGLQELFTADEVEQLRVENPEYDVLFYMDETSDYADASIWWKADRYTLVESGYYWLSPAPDLPFSVGFASPQFPRIVAWAVFSEPATGAEFLFATTHFDNNSPSQELSAPLLLERTDARARGLPIIVTGDFNSTPDSTAYAILDDGVAPGSFSLTNSFDLAADWSVDSNEDPAPGYDPAQRIDHIWVAGGTWSVPWWVVDTWVYGASALPTSDHFMMAAELHFEG